MQYQNGFKSSPLKHDPDSWILIAEDDEDDFLLMRDAFIETEFTRRIEHVRNGEELLTFIFHNPAFSQNPPKMILLDLNMPKVGGLEALRKIRTHPIGRRIPVHVITTSRSSEEVVMTYDLGANSFIPKPYHYSELVEAIRVMNDYWFKTAQLP